MKLLFTGDVAFNQASCTDDPNPLAALVPVAQAVDTTILSFDSGVGPLPEGPWSRPLISCPTECLSWLADVPRLALNLANNHVLDFGEESLWVGHRQRR